MTTRHSLLVALVALTLVGTPAVAYASVPTQETPEERLAATADATLGAGSARIEGSVTFAGEASTVQGALPLTGSLTIDGRNGAITLDLTAILASIGKLDTLVVDGVNFIALPALLDAAFLDVEDLPKTLQSKRWVRVDSEDLAEAGLQSASASDPQAQFVILRTMSDVQDLGIEDVRGEPSTHLQGTLRLKRALKRVTKAERERLEAALEQFEEGPVPVDVWLDGQNRLRRFAMQVHAPATSSDVVVSVDYPEFGVPVTVASPPAAEVIGYTKFIDTIRDVLNR